MSTPHELRDKLSKSSFFTQIAIKLDDEEDVQFVESSSSLLFGINQSESSLIQVRLTSSQPVSTHSPLPVHHVDHIKHSPGGSLALWSKLGCSVIKHSDQEGSVASAVNLRLGSSQICSVRWSTSNSDADSLHILSNKNEIYSFSRGQFGAAPVLTSFVAVCDDIVDFVPLTFGDKEAEFLTISSNGFLRINNDILINVEIEGDLVLAQIDTHCFVVANSEFAAHILMLEDEAFIVEKIELRLQGAAGMKSSVGIIVDESCKSRYFIHSNRNGVFEILSFLSFHHYPANERLV